MQPVFKPKFFSLVKQGISKKQVTADVLSGVVVGIIALPLAIAFAVASGVSPEKGIITAIIAGFLISLFGGSRVQIGGPTGAFIVIVYGIVSKYGLNGLLISTFLSGILLILFGILRLGSLLKYFPYPLVVGFTSGIAVVIFSTQVRDALGLEIDKIPSDFIAKWQVYFSHLDNINWIAFSITLVTIFIVVFTTKFTTKVPGSFIAIVLITAIVQYFHIHVATIETFFGEIPNKIQFAVPNLDFQNISKYFAPALIIALLGSIESLLSAVVSDGMIGGNHRSNTELIAQGIANIASPFFGGIPATGAIARTATNVKNGGRTPIAGIVHAVTLLLIMLVLGKWAKLIPMAALAGILIVVAYNMSEWRQFRAILRGSKFDITILLVVFLLTVFVDLTVAIEIGVVLSALLFMKRMSDSVIKIPQEVDSDLIADYSNLPKEISVYEINGPLFFASAKHYTETLKATGFKSKIIIIRMRHVPFIDSTGLHNFKDVIKVLKNSGTTIILSGINERVMHDLETYHFMINKSQIFDSFKDAVNYAKTENKKTSPQNNIRFS